MTAITDFKIPQDAENALRERGYTVIKLPPHPALPDPIASHPDMLVFFANDAVFCTKSYQTIAKTELQTISKLCDRPLKNVKKEYGIHYPQDILLNAALIGNKLFCHPRHTADELTQHSSYRICAVKQGYAKCSTIPVGQGALITEDASITATAKKEGLDTLTIVPNEVLLPGYSTGFLGGASSFSPYHETKEIFFCGDLDRHSSAEAIKQFCENHSIKTISLSSSRLTDVGTIFLI